MSEAANPFHAGERAAQARAGVPHMAAVAAGFIRPFMPDQHRDFFAQLPFLVLAGADADGRHWVTVLDGAPGFVRSPDARTLTVDARPDPQDPLAEALNGGTDVGMLGIELATRRRNRMNGAFRPNGAGFAIDVHQSFGNCPQYIHERRWRRVAPQPAPQARRGTALSADQIARIRAADTLFIGTGQAAPTGQASNGFDASHRGGAPGFVAVADATHLRIPDYAGNNFFNTIGNLLQNPKVGLVFVDFETGGLLQISGRATVDWEARDSHDGNARRMIDVTVEAVVDRPAALSLRWARDDAGLRDLVVADKIVEAEGITSFHLAAADGAPLAPFEAGQHLPIEVAVPGQSGPMRRSYSLSGAPSAPTYRLSIKREDRGVVSRFLHDGIGPGDRIRARAPAGDFVVPCERCPLVLVSAGIGLTPMLSILHDVAARAETRPVWYVHGARNGAQHALRAEVDALVADRPTLRRHIRYSRPRSTDRHGRDYDGAGRVTAQTLLDLNPGTDAHYMLCGPAGFVTDIQRDLQAAGVPTAQIHIETFGPTG